MLTGRRYLLAFTAEQAVFAERVGAVCRAVWNTALEQRREYRRRGAHISYVEQARQLAEAKKDPDCAWLADAPSHTLQQTLRDLENLQGTRDVEGAVAVQDPHRAVVPVPRPEPHHRAPAEPALG